MEAPECVVCGKREWRHVCGYVAKDKVTHNQPKMVTFMVTCEKCAEKDKEIEGLVDALIKQRSKCKPKRDRAEYMKMYRAVKGGRAERCC